MSRFVRAGITKDQWPTHMKEVHRILRPGTGWIQAEELDPRLHCDDGSCPENAPVFRVLLTQLIEFIVVLAHYKFQEQLMSKVRGNNLYPTGEFLESVVKDAGFVDIEYRLTKMYPGIWAYGHSSTFVI